MSETPVDKAINQRTEFNAMLATGRRHALICIKAFRYSVPE
jgi:hypothetical protein